MAKLRRMEELIERIDRDYENFKVGKVTDMHNEFSILLQQVGITETPKSHHSMIESSRVPSEQSSFNRAAQVPKKTVICKASSKLSQDHDAVEEYGLELKKFKSSHDRKVNQ